ncbi:MAG: MgtC/SapB family protein [bacterium]|nr:MgtC/SapB family protein [bacterium]
MNFLPAIDFETYRIFFQLVLAMLLGAVVGLEREVHGKPAGLRTYALVSLGACLFTVISIYGFQGMSGGLPVDPSRVAANIVVGIGFLGGGLIFLKGDVVYGLTTAAGLWVSAALGTAVGAGLLWPAIFATLLVLLILTILKTIEKRIHRNNQEGVRHDLA